MQLRAGRGMAGLWANILATAGYVSLASFVQAADYTWGGGNGNWSDANWNPGPVSGPTANTDTATISGGTVSLNVAGMNVGSLTLGAGGTFDAYNYNGVNTYTGYGNVFLQGGVLNGIGNYHNWGAGVLVNTTVSGSSASTISASSFFNLNGTGVNSSVFTVADVTGDANTDLNVSAALQDISADTSWVAAALIKEGAGTMSLGAINGYSGGTTVNGGTLVLNSTVADLSVVRGTLTVNSGATVSITGTDYAGLGKNSGANVTHLDVNGGAVVNAVESWLTGASANLTGGTMSGGRYHILNSSLNSKASATVSTISSAILIRKDYGSVDLNIDVEDGAAAADLHISGNISEVGPTALGKTGAGTLVLSGGNTYTGATTVQNGTLLIDGTHTGGGLITVSAGATLGGNGDIGDVEIADGGILAPGASAGHLTTDDLTLNPTSVLNFELGAPSLVQNPGSDFVTVGEVLTLAGTLNITAMPGFGTPVGGESWLIMTAANGIADNGIALGSTPALGSGLSFSIDYASGTEVYLNVVPEAGTADLFGLALLILRRVRRA